MQIRHVALRPHKAAVCWLSPSGDARLRQSSTGRLRRPAGYHASVYPRRGAAAGWCGWEEAQAEAAGMGDVLRRAREEGLLLRMRAQVLRDRERLV